MVFLGWDPAKVRRLLSAYLILNVFTKICMPLRECLPNPCPMGAADSRVICSVGMGRVVAARVLTGLVKLAPGKDLAGGTCFIPLLFVVLALVLLQFHRASVLPWLTSLALLGVAVPVAQTARAQS